VRHADHIIVFIAHQVQFPIRKINANSFRRRINPAGSPACGFKLPRNFDFFRICNSSVYKLTRIKNPLEQA